ncbi:MAG: acyl carrier protein [Polyangiales bacterium]
MNASPPLGPNVPAPPTPDLADIRPRVVRLLATILERDPASLTDVQQLRADLGMDSLNALEFLSSLSQEFAIDLEVEDAFGLTTLDEVVALVASRVRPS